MIKIRLSRTGVKNKPFYRIVAIEDSRKRAGRPLDVLGYWHPSKEDLKIDKEKIEQWKAHGAQITKAVDRLINQ